MRLCVVINFYIGSAVSFFGVNLFFDKLYTYTELESINLPMKKTEMCIVPNTIAVGPDVVIGSSAAILFLNLLYINNF